MSSVLIVDDSLTVRKDLEEAFAAAGFEPTLRADVRGAREALSRRCFSAIVLDVLLPDGDGLDLLDEIRKAPQHADTPVLMLSTEAEIRQRVRGLRMGADEFVGKPYDAPQLVARARTLLRQREALGQDAARGPVLVVDDSLTAREELRAALERAGLEVVTAASGEEGLLVAASRRPSAAVVDGVMPGMDGATFLRQLRGDAALRSTPCIMLTASGAGGELPALEAGADAYLLKEEGHAVVVARLQALVRSSRRGAPAVTGGSVLSPQRIVAVGDGEALLGEIIARLRQDGHDVVPARSPAEALELMSVDRVDCLLLDETTVPLPLEACRLVKSDPRRRDVPLLLLGARDEQEPAIEAINAGADDYVAVVSGPEVLRAHIRAQLRRKQFEDENRLRETYARNSAILETVSDAFFALDREWRFVYVNHALEALLEAGRHELLGQSLWERGRWLASGICQQELRRAAGERSPVSFEAHSGGRWFEVRAFPHGEGLSAHVRDVSERRRAQEVQRHLVGIVGHDLRTPLTAISASAAFVLRDSALAEKHRRAIGRVANGAARMTRLINDLLDYSLARLGQGMPIAPRSVDLDAICRGALEEMRPIHPGCDVAYRCEGDGVGEWDPDRIAQVLVNLINNALRYGDGARVELSWKGEQDRAVLKVHNHGPRIDPLLLEEIFEPFKRGDASGASSGTGGGGVGLGLYIVKEIALAHGGTVEVQSEEAAGTTFTVSLPRRRSAGRP